MGDSRNVYSGRAEPSGHSWLSQALGPPEYLRITGHDHGEGAVVAAAGELDVASSPLLGAHFDKLVLSLRTHVVVDLVNLDFCDCAGLNQFLQTRHTDLEEFVEVRARDA